MTEVTKQAAGVLGDDSDSQVRRRREGKEGEGEVEGKEKRRRREIGQEGGAEDHKRCKMACLALGLRVKRILYIKFDYPLLPMNEYSNIRSPVVITKYGHLLWSDYRKWEEKVR